MSQNIQNYFIHSPSFSQESPDFFQEQLPSNQQKDTSSKIQHLEHGRLKLTNVVVAYHTNYQTNKQPEKSSFESMMSSKNQIEKSDQDMKEIVWKKAKQSYDKIIINNDKKDRDKVTGIYPLQYNLPIQKREINLPISSVKASQEKQNNSLLNSKKIEDRLYPLQFQQLKKLEQLRQYKFKQEMSELRDPEIDCHSQEIISSRPKLKIEERLISEGKKMQQKQEQKVQEYENHLRQISTPKINQSIHSPIQIQMNAKNSKINQENEICDTYEFEETDVVERLLSFQSKYQQKKLQMEQLSKQNKLQQCTFKPEITKKAQKLVRNIKVLQGSSNRKASLQIEIKNKQSTLTQFKPQINKQSEILARKRGKSFERLTKPKTIKQQTQQSFKPTINHQSQLLVQRQQNVFDLLYQKNQQYKNNLEKKKEKIQSETQQKEQQEYTFKPKINEYISKSFFENKNESKDFVNSLEGFNKQKQQVHQRLLE